MGQIDIENVKEIINAIDRNMRLVKAFPLPYYIRNSYRYTEKYYNWLLPYVSKIDEAIPGFSRSWMSYRRNFDGMNGLVSAAKEIYREKDNSTQRRS